MSLRVFRPACWLAAGLTACVLAASGAPARAQLGLLPQVRLKAGIFLPQNASLKNAVGNTWFKIGADVGVPFSPIPLTSGRAEIDYVGNGSSNVIPVLYEIVFQPSAGLRSPVYLGAGAGLWTGHIRGASTATRIGGRIFGGVDIGTRAFLELQYDFVDSISGARVDGFSALIGTRF